ncbi:MAG TPA: M13 family metallopeptidase N-terminal domain-containing protein, partial [Longimicrobiaceae bacterium]|nr:M13 family metallopeptidase N-terminal domain-containing protein [Longimicrobiaceae bacterium]
MTTRLPARRAALLAALLATGAGPAAAQNAPLMDAAPAPLKVVDTAYMDRSANACTDFFQFANGGWLKRDTIPAAYSSSGVGRDMGDRNELVVRRVLDEAVARRATLAEGSTERKLGTFYGSCMDSTAIEAAGVRPLQPQLDRIAAVRTRAALIATVAELQKTGANVLFAYNPDVDPHDAAHYLAGLHAAGLGLPDRDYYVNTGAAADSTRDAYV